ncbi:hypothetical protein T08_9998 [Trichinella sp. T8]|nr:hypothetical protein T08_9998 [Trichinella sp. T8]
MLISDWSLPNMGALPLKYLIWTEKSVYYFLKKKLLVRFGLLGDKFSPPFLTGR